MQGFNPQTCSLFTVSDKDRQELKAVRKLLNAVQDLIAFVEAN
jgi:hypothetical protein